MVVRKDLPVSTCNRRFLPFRETPILKEIVDEWDVVVGRSLTDPLWKELSPRLKIEEPEFFAHLKAGWKIYGQVFPHYRMVWINDRQSADEFWDAVIHEFLHVYERESIDHSRRLASGQVYSRTTLWVSTFRKYGVTLPKQYFPETQIIQEASNILSTRPDIVGFFQVVYPQLSRDKT